MTEEQKIEILNFIQGDFKEIKNIEVNCGTLWFDDEYGQTWSVIVSECEMENKIE